MTTSGRRWGWTVLMFTLVAGTQGSCSATGDPPAAVGAGAGSPDEPQWADVHGRDQQPLVTEGRPATVLLFIATDCPISNAYAPEVNRIVDAYDPRGVAFFAVHADPSVSADAARGHAESFGYRCPVLLDPRQVLADRAGATVTPEAAVLDRAGRVAYVGRIDDLFASYGKRRHAPTTHELRDALDAVLADQPVARPSVPAIGCDIPEPVNKTPAAITEAVKSITEH